ncbi:MAG: archaellin/type IV pilin N-terminal domain-containing protein [Nanoarchaeota archaeon]
MNRRGVSPVVATVLLIVIVVVLAGIIFLWAKGFLSESAVKGDRVVETSCADVKFEAQIVENAGVQCTNNEAAIDINNIGSIPIYGVQVLRYDSSTGSIDTKVIDQPFNGGTITVGKSTSTCLGISVGAQDSFRVVPKLLAEKGEKKIAYTCPEKDGITVAVV